MAATYDTIGEGYDGTRRADVRLVERLIGHLAPVPGGRYLDLACGTGNYTAALAARDIDIAGVDASGVMLDAARAKAPAIAWSKGRAEDLPYADGAFDGVMCSLAIHHFGDVGAAFAEVARVLGRGRLVILTTTPAQIAGYWLNWYFPEAYPNKSTRSHSSSDLPYQSAEIECHTPWRVPARQIGAAPQWLQRRVRCPRSHPSSWRSLPSDPR